MMDSIYLIPISGRPNAGKTSLVNFLSGSKRPVGKKAGTTLKINKIPLIKNLFIVDLPGFGRITRRSKQYEDITKDKIIEFFDNSKNQFLFGIHIIDISTFHHMVMNLEKKGIIPIDIEMINFISEKTFFPPLIIMNKIDKVNRELIEQNLSLFYSFALPELELFQVSFRNMIGCYSLRNRIKEIIVSKMGISYQNW